MITTAFKHYLYDLALNIFFDAVSNNFYMNVNLIGKKVKISHIDSGVTYTVIVTEVNTPDYSMPNIKGTLEDVENDLDCKHLEDEFGSIFIFELKYFNMIVL